uniref:Uncharacterized protein n=1 Tax=Corynecladia elata TaxID=3101723 RepID=A0AA51NFR3_9FLOR|nr:hypothetical protein RU988_pgp092 [Laurencia elata]WMP12702.1 hypothetical protein [Laurencia elata]
MFIIDFIVSFTLQLLCMPNYDIIILVNKFILLFFILQYFRRC